MKAHSVVLKANILAEGLRIGDETISFLSKIPNYKHESFVYNDSHWELGKTSNYCPQELMLCMENGLFSTVTSCIVSRNSNLSLNVLDNRLIIVDETGKNNYSDVQVQLLPQPSFWNEFDPRGVQLGRIISTCGYCEANVWLWHDCMFPYLGKACKFCGINSVSTKRKNEDLLSAKNISSLHDPMGWWKEKRGDVLTSFVFAYKRALETYAPYKEHFHLVFISGNLSNKDLDLQWQIYVEAMDELNRAGIPLSNIDSTAILMPPNNLVWLRRAHEAGLKVVGFNLEIWKPEIFENYCPGKAEYGRQRMIEALKEAVSIFGVGSVWSNFVFGLEPRDELMEGMEYLSTFGVTPGANVFHKDRGAQLNNINIPSTDEIISFYKELADLYHRFNFKPFYCEKALRTSLSNEAYYGWLD